MGVRPYQCPKDKTQKFEAYVNMRSKEDRKFRVQMYQKCDTEAQAKKAEKQLIRKATDAVSRHEAKGNAWRVVISFWESEANKIGGNPLTGKKISPKTIRDACNAVRTWTPEWLDKPPKEITRTHGRKLINGLKEEGLSQNFIRKVKSQINTIWDFGVMEGIVKGEKNSPVYGLVIEHKEEDKVPEILTIAQVRKLLSESERLAHPWHDVWACALLTGMRSSELYALRKESVNLADGTIRICESWDWQARIAKSTKARYWRTAPIEPKLLRPMVERLMSENPDREFLLPRLKDWEKGLQANVLRDFCEKIGIPSVRFHTLRACFATHMLASGEREDIVRKIGGWADYKTFNIYVRLAAVNEKGATDGLGRIFSDEDATDRQVAKLVSLAQNQLIERLTGLYAEGNLAA